MQIKSKQFFYVSIVLLLISAGAVGAAFVTGQNQLKAKSEVVSNLLAERDVSREKILLLQKAQVDAENIESVQILLDRLLPAKKEQEKLIADVIYTATGEAGIPFSQVSSFSFTGGNEPSDLSGTKPSIGNAGVFEYPFSLQINSISYATLLKLLSEIETNGRIVQVENIQISPESENPDNVSVNLSTKAFLKP